MAKPVDCDVLIVGAGPAGSCAAIAAAKQGARVLLVDAKTRIGERPHCGEFVPAQLFGEFPLNRGCIVQKVSAMETCIVRLQDPRCEMDAGSDNSSDDLFLPGFQATPGGEDQHSDVLKRVRSASPGYLIDRVRFDRELAREAARLGATIMSSTRLICKEGDWWVVRHGSEERAIRPRFVVGADGAVSTVAASVGMSRPIFLKGVQVEVPLSEPMDRTLVLLGPELMGGYGWLFPKGKVANAGIGVSSECPAPRRLLGAVLQLLLNMGVIRPGVLASYSGLIPVSGIRRELARDNVILCGDAAGLTHPVTGAGIPQAVFSGIEAGRATALAAASADSRPLRQYEAEVRGRYGGIMAHALSKRKMMTARWNDADFFALCERTWIGFKGYGKREGKRHSGTNRQRP